MGAIAAAVDVPLCVDLDGTLVSTDTLHESLLGLARKQPAQLLRAPLWLLGGKAHFKRELAARVLPDVEHLPYRKELLAHLAGERDRGRRLVLATGADERVARAIAAHLGLFSDVVASDGKNNLTAQKKLLRLVERFGSFDYAGDGSVDLPVWTRARQAIVVSQSRRLVTRVRRRVPVAQVFSDRGGGLKILARALRVHQWVKNLLVFVPALAAHSLTNFSVLAHAVLAFVAFSLCASAGYLLNDMIDLESDRRDPKKQHRPLAAGALSIPGALLMIPTLLATGLAIGRLASPLVAGLLLLHFATTVTYSLRWKQVAVLDVLTLAGLYTLRIFTGAAAEGVPVSPWLLALTMFTFLSLALVKRASELRRLRERGLPATLGRGYLTDDFPIVMALGAASGYLGVLILALYIHSPDVTVLYPHAARLWLLCPLLLYWFSRIWLLTHRGEVDADPVAFALKDRPGYVIGALGLAIAWLAS
jgi:4-hydroxybenzoate polyprenyltransferase